MHCVGWFDAMLFAVCVVCGVYVGVLYLFVLFVDAWWLLVFVGVMFVV